MMMINKQAYHRSSWEGGVLLCSVTQSQKPVISNAQLPRFYFTALSGPVSFLINSAVILDNRRNSLNQWAWIYKRENKWGFGPHWNFLNWSIELNHWSSFVFFQKQRKTPLSIVAKPLSASGMGSSGRAWKIRTRASCISNEPAMHVCENVQKRIHCTLCYERLANRNTQVQSKTLSKSSLKQPRCKRLKRCSTKQVYNGLPFWGRRGKSRQAIAIDFNIFFGIKIWVRCTKHRLSAPTTERQQWAIITG